MDTKHFKQSELACNHCGEVKVYSELLAVLELIRHHFKSPITVTSGYRCETHNANVGGSDNSQHKLGTAADIIVKGVHPHDVYSFIDSVFPNSYGVGKYNDFTHIDVRSNKGRW